MNAWDKILDLFTSCSINKNWYDLTISLISPINSFEDSVNSGINMFTKLSSWFGNSSSGLGVSFIKYVEPVYAKLEFLADELFLIYV